MFYQFFSLLRSFWLQHFKFILMLNLNLVCQFIIIIITNPIQKLEYVFARMIIANTANIWNQTFLKRHAVSHFALDLHAISFNKSDVAGGTSASVTSIAQTQGYTQSRSPIIWETSCYCNPHVLWRSLFLPSDWSTVAIFFDDKLLVCLCRHLTFPCILKNSYCPRI